MAATHTGNTNTTESATFPMKWKYNSQTESTTFPMKCNCLRQEIKMTCSHPGYIRETGKMCGKHSPPYTKQMYDIFKRSSMNLLVVNDGSQLIL